MSQDFDDQFDQQFKAFNQQDLKHESGVHKAVREILIKAGLDIEYDLADPDVLETVRDFLINY
jgi:hypothetical protein